ncbi:MAG TPA: tRNA (adenosine(37)-N6)-dimethylallyltransferase MiaA [Ilumatobacter sp.]|nr:tRNA (adenosine(37)-N6)-dimethylallyltransferase MiaA [Ilumatobacter sp.]
MTAHTVPQVAVVGPTASGKSAVAMAVAHARTDVELVSVDSMQVYRRMDIGTAKPSRDDRAAVRHHLIDLVEPTDEFTVAEFQRAFASAVSDIATRGGAALLVGGTGLYHRAAIDRLDLPGEWPELRLRLQAEAAQLGPAALHRRLASIDPAAADKIEPANDRRIIRALEVCEGSGRRFSSFGPGLHAYPPSDVMQIGLLWPREVLSERVMQRVHAMLESGLLDEVRSLQASGFSKTAAQALGYKELLAYERGEVSYDEAVENIVVRTRQFAVRQIRWFRRDPRVRWIEIEHDPVAEVAPVVIAALEQTEGS